MGPETTFFSYARSDSDFVLKLARDLRQAGADVWLDQLDIKAGSRWDLSVETALKKSSKMVIILSPESVASNNVMDEVAFALEEGKAVIPVLLKTCDIPFRLRRLQHADFTKNYDEGLENLMRALNLEKLLSGLPGKDDSNPAIKVAQESEKDETLKSESNRLEEERKLKEQAESERLEEQRKFKEQAEWAKIENKSKNISEAPTFKKNKYKTPVIVAGIILVLVIVIWIVNTGRKDDPAEIQAWNEALAINSIDGYKTYQINYPAGSHFNHAQSKLDSIDYVNLLNDENAWNEAKSANTITSYQSYQSKYPKGLHFNEAGLQITAFNDAAKLAIGNEYQGGIIFYIDEIGRHGLIAAPFDQYSDWGEPTLRWSSEYIEIGSTETEIGTGKRNTDMIVDKLGAGNYAAKTCFDLVLNGYDDWFLPSMEEFDQLYLNQKKVGGFTSNAYWCSSEVDTRNAWGRSFGEHTGQGGVLKTDALRVRAIRAF